MPAFATFAPALFVVFWATGFIGARYAMPWSEPFHFLTVRFIISAALIGLIAMWMRAPRLPRDKIGHAMIAGALMHGVYLGSVFWAIRHGMPAGLSALIVGLQPLITAFIARPTLGEQIEPRHWTGLAIGFAGVLTVLWPKLGVTGEGVNAATLSVSFLSVLGMSIGTIWQKRFLQGTGLISGTFWQYLGGAVLGTGMALMTETGTYVLTGELVFAMAWLVLVLSLGAVLILMYLIREGAISRVASLFYLVPPCTALMAWVLFGEDLSAIQIVGIAVTSAGVALATARPRPRPAASGSA